MVVLHPNNVAFPVFLQDNICFWGKGWIRYSLYPYNIILKVNRNSVGSHEDSADNSIITINVIDVEVFHG